jgi:protein arginine kinase activator
MLCQCCNKKQATLSYTEIRSGRARHRVLCEECALSQGLMSPMEAAISSLSDLLTQLMTELAGSAPALPDVSCSRCGLKFSQFQKSGRLGCPGCYRGLAEKLDPLILQLQQSDRHLGKSARIPKVTQPPTMEQARMLKRQLSAAVESEQFELAASLRDRLKILESEQVM